MDAPPDNSVFLCDLSDIADESSKGFTLGNDNLFAVKRKGKIFLYRNSCPHLGIPLEWVKDQFLDSSSSMIQCANHGALFVIETGKCVSGPCSGRKLEAVLFFIKDNRVFIESPVSAHP
jgi:nitrite reductase/ring-hydroxylating ferredoxin subunit